MNPIAAQALTIAGVLLGAVATWETVLLLGEPTSLRP